MRVEVIGCRLPDDGIASADRFSSFSTPYPQVYRADVYSHVNTGSFPHLHSSTVDQSISTGTFIDSGLYAYLIRYYQKISISNSVISL